MRYVSNIFKNYIFARIYQSKSPQSLKWILNQIILTDSAGATNSPLTVFLYEMTSTSTSLRLFSLRLILDEDEPGFSLTTLPLKSTISCCTLSSVSPPTTNTSVMSSVSKWLEYPILMAVSGKKVKMLKNYQGYVGSRATTKSSTKGWFFSFYSLFTLFSWWI